MDPIFERIVAYCKHLGYVNPINFWRRLGFRKEVYDRQRQYGFGHQKRSLRTLARAICNRFPVDRQWLETGTPSYRLPDSSIKPCVNIKLAEDLAACYWPQIANPWWYDRHGVLQCGYPIGVNGLAAPTADTLFFVLTQLKFLVEVVSSPCLDYNEYGEKLLLSCQVRGKDVDITCKAFQLADGLAMLLRDLVHQQKVDKSAVRNMGLLACTADILPLLKIKHWVNYYECPNCHIWLRQELAIGNEPYDSLQRDKPCKQCDTFYIKHMIAIDPEAAEWEYLGYHSDKQEAIHLAMQGDRRNFRIKQGIFTSDMIQRKHGSARVWGYFGPFQRPVKFFDIIRSLTHD